MAFRGREAFHFCRVSSEQATGFFLTHAYVYALEAGDARADQLRRALVRLGRDVPAAINL